MLFKQIYNWIKYKTLPSSILFKNRLYIERDSKNRRIFNNFGLTFRNSKWSNFENNNITTLFKTKYLKFLTYFFGFFLLFLILKFENYYFLSFFFNKVFFFFWSGLDTFDYYLSFIFWSVVIAFSLLTDIFYSFFFFNSFLQSEKSFSKIQKPTFFFKHIIEESHTIEILKLSKKDYKPFLYSWLNNDCNNSIKISTLKNKIISDLFEKSLNNLTWTTYYDFFIKLYKLTSLLSLNSPNVNIFNLSNKLYFLKNNQNINFLFYLANNNKLDKFTNLILHIVINKNENYFAKFAIHNNNLIKTDQWNLYNFVTDYNNYNFLLKTKIGFLYLHKLNLEQLNFYFNTYSEFNITFLQINNQLINSKWNRWLYRYSILHRKMFKNSNKITLSKTLLNAGLYDINISQKNLWNSSIFNNFLKDKPLHSITNLFYMNLLENAKKNNFLTNPSLIVNNTNYFNNLKLLKLYENSYFWAIKRFYFLNTLFLNKTTSTFKIKNSSMFHKKTNDLTFNYLIILKYLNQSVYFNLESFSFFTDKCKKLNIINSRETNHFNLKDIYLMFNENDLYNKDVLNILIWLNTTNNTNHQLTYFNYNIFNLNSINLINENDEFNCDNIINENINLKQSLINFDNDYLKDLIFLNFFLQNNR